MVKHPIQFSARNGTGNLLSDINCSSTQCMADWVHESLTTLRIVIECAFCFIIFGFECKRGLVSTFT